MKIFHHKGQWLVVGLLSFLLSIGSEPAGATDLSQTQPTENSSRSVLFLMNTGLPGAAYLEDGVSLVPLRSLAHGLGYEINYDPLGQEIFLYQEGGISIQLRNQDDRMWVNGEEKQLPEKVVILDGRTFGPVRAIAAELGAETSWDQTNKTATISITRKIEVTE